MPPPPEGPAWSALFRMIAARLPGAGAAVFAARRGQMRLIDASPGLVFAGPHRPADWRAINPPLAEALARPGGAPIAPEALGLVAVFAAARGIVGAGGAPSGFLVVCDARPRRLAGGVAAALADAADLAAPLLPAARRRAPAPGPRPGLQGRPAGPVAPADAGTGAGSALVLLVEAAGAPPGAATPGEAGVVGHAAVAGARIAGCRSPRARIMGSADGRLVNLTARSGTEALALAEAPIAADRPARPPDGVPDAAPVRAGAPAKRPAGEGRESATSRALVPLGRVGGPGRGGGRASGAGEGPLEAELAAAARRGEMRLVYQGYVDLADGRVSGVEALLRWRHPSRGELAPAAFIPLAEASGLILPLGAWALRTALDAAAGWPRRLVLSVNVSALQFHQPGFVAEVEAALEAAGVAPDRLELEITETVLMRDTSETIAQIDALIAKGVRIALDDFGTGYSALAYLGRLPHHRIKLDRCFVQDLANPATFDLVQAILALARKAGVAVTAEGVERPEQLALVRALGFTHAQGFVTGPPLADPRALIGASEPAF